MNSLTPTYARTATMNLFALFEGTAPGDLVTVETTDGRTFEGELVEAEVKLARESFGIEDNGLVVTFERADGHRMRVSQYSDGVRVRTEFDDPHTSYESFRDLNGSPGVENVGVEQADEDLGEPETPGEDEFDDDEPRETCGDCGGEAVHVATRRTNAWINEASAPVSR